MRAESCLSYLWLLCVWSAPGLRGHRCVGNDSSPASCLHGGRLWAFASAKPWFLNFSSVSNHTVDPTHVHLGQGVTQRVALCSYKVVHPIRTSYYSFCVRNVLILNSRLCLYIHYFTSAGDGLAPFWASAFPPAPVPLFIISSVSKVVAR